MVGLRVDLILHLTDTGSFFMATGANDAIADPTVAKAGGPDNALAQVGAEEGFNATATFDGDLAAGVAKAGTHFQVGIRDKTGSRLLTLTLTRPGNDCMVRMACIVDLGGYICRIHKPSLILT